MPKTLPVKDGAESKRWLIIGAHQAGATEKHIARISGLSKTAVRNIILNYQRTGTPCIPKKMPKKVRQKLIVEYDENGNIIDSDDDEEQQQEEEEAIQQQQQQKQQQRPKISPKLNVTTKDIIGYTIDKLKHSGTNKEIPSPPPSTITTIGSSSKLPPPAKFDQDIRGYELWTHDDDLILLNYVLHHLHGGGWNELELRFDGRHSARLCNERWQHLKSLMLKGISEKSE